MFKKNKTYIIAEVGPNHNGSYKLATKYLKELSKSDVDAVKFQLSDPKLTLSLNSLKIPYGKRSKRFNSELTFIFFSQIIRLFG